MKRLLLTATASSLATALLLGGAGLVLAQRFVGQAFAESVPFAPPMAANLPPEIRDLHELPPAERFGHLQGGQFRFTDTKDKTHTVNITPGTVQSFSADSLTLKLNEGGTKSFKLSSETRVHRAGAPWNGGQAQATLKNDDRAVVVTLDGGEARSVMIGGAEGFGPRFRHGPPHQGQ